MTNITSIPTPQTVERPSSLITSARLNNRAHALMAEDGEQNHHEEAIAVLSSALRTVKQAIASVSPPAHLQPEQQQQQETTTQETHPSRIDHQQGIISLMDGDTNNRRNNIKNGSAAATAGHISLFDTPAPYIYQEPIPITAIPAHPTTSTAANLSFVIMFNLALAYHQSALTYNPSSSSSSSADEESSAARRKERLSTAKKLYECTFQMQQRHLEVESNLFVASGILNNLTMVHKELGNSYEQGQCEQMLLSTVLLLVDITGPRQAGGNADITAHDQHDVIDGFLHNVMHLLVRERTTASAA